MAFPESMRQMHDVICGLRRCDAGGELEPCAFYDAHTHRLYTRYCELDDTIDVVCTNKRRRGFSKCPKNKRRCCEDMLNDIFDAVDKCYEDGE